jgi:hypothetical protein
MREHAAAVLAEVTYQQRRACQQPLDSQRRTQWTYLPRPRPGVQLADLTVPARKAVWRLLAAALSRPAFAQAMTVAGLEEVLDGDEDGRRGRHGGDYWIVVFGSPVDPAWCWRLEGHHLSVTMTICSDQVAPGPVFLGAHPARVTTGSGRTVLAPFGAEEDLARALLAVLDPEELDLAVVEAVAPADIHTLDPPGVPVSRLTPPARGLLAELTGMFLDRLAPPLAAQERLRLGLGEGCDLGHVYFAWEGPPDASPGVGHYFRITSPGLLVEYANTQHQADHVHSVLRLPGQDFGTTLLYAHSGIEGQTALADSEGDGAAPAPMAGGH